MQDIITAVGLIIGFAGVGLTIYYQRRSVRFDKLRKSLDWADLQVAASELAKDISAVGQIAAIVTPSLAGATFANLLADQIGGQPPVYVGIRIWKGDDHPDLAPNAYLNFDTNKWLVSIPKEITTYREGIILFVDDFVMSGDFLERFANRLVKEGVDREQIRSASVAVTRVAIKNHKAPTFYWWVADDDEFYFPWGKAR
jgi:hypoxanthine phosphoribosyltransferase